ncbi:TRAP transporter substrate-binding protein [Azospirillum halopraeferens]|uniref:TRAP transporter substrate-binding protein n=1 Tax=Azospirillum halopraeferens TaxID=34010 RepID=UPI0004186035|nr:TRAP transporter substrate-binding protein [Azospirillum halopraeferens]
MHRFRRPAASWLAIAVALGTMTYAQTADARRITAATTLSSKDVSTRALEHWAGLLKERTDGGLTMNVIPGGTLGGDREHLQQLSSGEIDINLSSPVALQHVAPQYQCLEAEYVYEDEDHGFRVWQGDVGREVSQRIREQYGIEIVGIGRRGARHLTANRPVNAPADLKGLKMRVTNNLRAAVFGAYGALPAPLPLSELYGGLRQRVFDAQENPLATIYANRFHEVQSHIVLTGHVWTYNIVLAGSRFLESLNAEERKAFDETLAQTITWLNDEATREDERIRSEIEKAGGVTFIEPDRAAFRAAARPVLAKYAEENCRPGLLADVDKAAAR